MKLIQFIFIAILVFIFACNRPGSVEHTTTNRDAADMTTDSLKAGNLVKSEAPDADTKMKQGYALPSFNEKNAQSPINILSDSALTDSESSVVLSFNSGVTAVENLGHTIQLDFKEGSITNLQGKTYTSKQFHFHTPSEHLIDGMTFPMEMHIVNLFKDSVTANHPQYLVIALLFKMGHENKFLEEFLNKIPHEEGKDTLAAGSVHMQDLYQSIPVNERGYFSYHGSLTTTPFTESVDWIVEKHIMEASPDQIYAIEKMEGDNARHVQALYTRRVHVH
jgi:carbonic anhydrase